MKYFNPIALQASGPGALYQAALNGPVLCGTVPETHLPTGINANKLADGTVSNTELQYINSLTSNVQTQLGGKLDSSVLTTNGDLLTRTAGSPARLGLGTSLQYLRVNTDASALEYATLSTSSTGLYFQALKTDAQIFNAQAWEKITFAAPTTNDMFTEVSDVFTATVAGWYLVTLNIKITSNHVFGLQLMKNTTPVSSHFNSNSELYFRHSGVVYLAVNDYLTYYGYGTPNNGYPTVDTSQTYYNTLTIASIG